MDQIPSSFYYIVGTLIVANIGTILGLIWTALKLTWFLSEKHTEFKLGIENSKDTAIRAHKRIDKLEGAL